MARLMEQLVGHDRQKKQLVEALRADHCPSTLIFAGPSGVGKKLLARALLQSLNCQKSPEACGECSTCLRVLEAKNEMIFELGREDKTVIAVESVRELQRTLSLQSPQKARMVIIDPADALSPASANALLKLLEEAPTRTFFVLITERVQALLPTLRSRSALVRFQRLTKEDLGRVAGGNETAMAWSDGRWTRALELQDEGARQDLTGAFEFLYALLYDPPQDWKKKSPDFFNATDKRKFYFEMWNLALSKRLSGEQKDIDWLPADRSQLVLVHEQLENLQKSIERNVDKTLALENFYYQVRQSWQH